MARFEGIDFYDLDSLFTEEERMIRDTVREWVEDRLMPVIGIPLPLISYGGSALLANTAMLAIALNLHAKRDDFAVYG